MRLEPRSALQNAFGIPSRLHGFKSDGTALRERTDNSCVLLTAAVNAADVVTSATAVARVELPLAPGAIKRGSGRTALWLSPRSWLIHCKIEEEMDLVADLNACFPEKLAHAVPFTDALCWFEISLSGALDLLTEGGFVSLERGGLPVGHAKRTLIAQVAVVILRESESVWLVGVERSRARYFADWLIAAAGAP
jgi:heterotetrameric sarcosine oxidase gamma subunit